MKNNKFPFLSTELSKKELKEDLAKYHILPIPLEKSVTFGKGTRNGPRAILKASQELERSMENFEPCKRGIFTYPNLDCSENIGTVLSTIENKAYKIAKQGKIPIGIGVEHTLTYPLVKGIQKALEIDNEEIGIIQIDAHADLRKCYQGKKYSHASVMYLLASEKFKIFQVGVRSISNEEQKNRTKFNVSFLDKSKNIKLPKNFPKKIYITFDSDGLDPSVMPATGTPVPRGLSYEDSIKILTKLIKDRHVLGFDYVEFVPVKDMIAYEFISANLIYNIIAIIELNS